VSSRPDADATGAARRGRWVVLDVGETLIDETRIFRTWAEVFGIPQFTLMAVLGGSISNE
jgi:hypothetical protein